MSKTDIKTDIKGKIPIKAKSGKIYYYDRSKYLQDKVKYNHQYYVDNKDKILMSRLRRDIKKRVDTAIAEGRFKLDN